MQWHIDSERPVYIQLIEQIQSSIISGYFNPGDKVPSVRDLAAQAGVNPNTMQKALVELERIGLVHTNRTKGRYITSDTEVIKKLKIKSANNITMDFLDNMKKLGFSKEETLKIIKKIVEEMKE